MAEAIQVLQPEDYAKHNAYELLSLAGKGLVAFDHDSLRAILADMPGVVRYANECVENGLDTEISADMVEIFRHRPVPEAVPFLAALAAEFRDDMPEELVEALARVGKPALEPLLAAYAANEDDPGELATVIAFLKSGDPRADAIFDALDPEEAEFLREIADAPREEPEPHNIFADYPERAVPNLDGKPLAVRKAFLASPRPEHRLAALSTFLEGDLSKEMSTELKRVAKEDVDDDVRGVAWETLEAEAGSNKTLLNEMIARLHADDIAPKERAGLLVALAQRNDPNFARAAALLYEIRETRAKALQAMWRSFNRDFARYAVESLADTDAEIKEQAILALGYLNQASQAGALEKLFQDDTHRDTALFAYALCAPSEVSKARMRQLFGRIEKLAGGLSGEDAATVEQALDLRLEMNGLEPVFSDHDHDHDEPHAPAPAAKEKEPGRNDPCPCGSGKKFKKCHGA